MLLLMVRERRLASLPAARNDQLDYPMSLPTRSSAQHLTFMLGTCFKISSTVHDMLRRVQEFLSLASLDRTTPPHMQTDTMGHSNSDTIAFPAMGLSTSASFWGEECGDEKTASALECAAHIQKRISGSPGRRPGDETVGRELTAPQP
eukprot:3641917-Amphidinium_carterae.1